MFGRSEAEKTRKRARNLPEDLKPFVTVLNDLCLGKDVYAEAKASLSLSEYSAWIAQLKRTMQIVWDME